MKEKIEAKLVELKKHRTQVRRRFTMYDNHEDMDMCSILDAQIELLEELLK